MIKFGEDAEGYAVPVLNEREIRASAGIMFLVLFISLIMILFQRNFLYVKYVVFIFFTDFIIRIFISPRYSPVLIIGRLIVSSQVPEYVGAAQKKFAWKIGLALSGFMFFLLDLVNSYSIITSISCFICLLFLFCESAFGICLGCLFYGIFYKDKVLHCAGETCVVAKKQAIQKTSWIQVLIVVFATLYILLTIFFLNDHFREAPRNLKDILKSM